MNYPNLVTVPFPTKINDEIFSAASLASHGWIDRLMKLITLPIFMVVLVVGGCVPAPPEHVLTSLPLSSGSLEIRYDTPFGFASHTVGFYYRKKGRVQFLAKTELANDGGSLSEQNLEITDLGNGNCRIVLKGQEQEDEVWLIKLTGDKVQADKIQADKLGAAK